MKVISTNSESLSSIHRQIKNTNIDSEEYFSAEAELNSACLELEEFIHKNE